MRWRVSRLHLPFVSSAATGRRPVSLKQLARIGAGLGAHASLPRLPRRLLGTQGGRLCAEAGHLAMEALVLVGAGVFIAAGCVLLR